MKINGKEYPINFNGRTLLLYKEEFKRDFFSAIGSMQENITNIFEIVYVLCKQSDKEFATEYKDFDAFMDNAPIEDILNEETMGEVTRALEKKLTPTKEVKKKVK